MLSKTGLLTIGILIVIVFGSIFMISSGKSTDDSWQNRVDCGLNSLTWAVRMSGIPVARSHVSFVSGTPGGSGYSLEQLKRGARLLCLFPKVHKTTVSEIFDVKPPFIAHLSGGRLDIGHFVAVKEIGYLDGERMMWVVDGSSGEEVKFSEEGAEKFFTGYIMTINTLPLRLVLCGLLACAFVLLFKLLAKTKLLGGSLARSSLIACILLLGTTGGFAQEIDGSLPSIDFVVQQIKENKKKILEYPGGISCKYQYSCLKDPTKDFAFQGKVNVENTWKWPKLFTSYDGKIFSGLDQNREGVYDFATNESFARDAEDGTMIGTRHMFTASFCLMFRYCHWAEGYQGYRYGESFSGDTIPDVIEREGGYRVIGKKDSEFGEVLHVSNKANDDIFLAVDRSYLPLKRIRKDPKTGLKSKTTQITEFVELDNGVWLPKVAMSDEFSGAERKNALRFRFLLDGLELGFDIPDDRFVHRITEGLRVNDLINDKNYIAGRQFSDGAGIFRPAMILLVVGFCLALIFVAISLSKQKSS